MSNLWELRVWLSVDENTIKSSTLKIKNEFQKAWSSIEKSLWGSWSKWLKDIKKESEKAVKTIWWLNSKLKSLNTELEDTKIWSKRFKELQKEISKTEKEIWKVTNKTSKLWWFFKWIGWWIVPISSATSCAYFKSGDPSRPTENECSFGNHASLWSLSSILFCEYFWVIAEITDESKPPDNNTP